MGYRAELARLDLGRLRRLVGRPHPEDVLDVVGERAVDERLQRGRRLRSRDGVELTQRLRRRATLEQAVPRSHRGGELTSPTAPATLGAGRTPE